MKEMRSVHCVFVTRGKRDYVHAVDMLHAAPISTIDRSFKFRFHRVLQSPGYWRSLDASVARDSIIAELSIQRETGPENWVFLGDASQTLVSAPDIFRAFETNRITYKGSVLTARLSPDEGFWEQLVEAVRKGGEILFPDKTWLTVGIAGTGACLSPLTEETALTLELISTRGSINSIRFSTSDGREGRILTAPRPAST